MQTNGTHYNYTNTSTVPYILNFQAVGMPFRYHEWNYSLLSATECALWYCIQAYNTSVTSNILNQTIIDTWNTVNPMTFGSDGNDNVTFANIPEHFNLNPGSTYSLYDRSLLGAEQFLYGMFNGSAEAGDEDGFNFVGNWTEPIWSGLNDSSRFIDNLAKSMTNNIRTTSLAPALSMYEGQAFREKLLVHVRWPWMVLPIALVLFSVLFLIVTILETRGSKVNAWKSSALALLFLDVGQGVRSSARDKMDEVNGLKDVAGRSSVVLKERDGFWGFREPGGTT
jgi:hypothetical protein